MGATAALREISPRPFENDRKEKNKRDSFINVSICAQIFGTGLEL